MGGPDTGWRLAGLALAWLAGVALQLREPALWPLAGYGAALGLGVLGLAAAWRWRGFFAAALLGMALLGWGASGWRAGVRLSEALPEVLEGHDIVVTGVVASLPQQGASGLRFRFAVDDARLGAEPVAAPPLVSLGWYKGFHEDAVLSQPQSELRAGQRWRFTVRLRQPHGNVNPHGFDYELYLFEQGVRATGYVRDAPALRLENAAGHPIERLRQRVRDAIDAQVPDRRAAGVLAALAVGDQGAIEREDWDLFRATGIAHLVSISGLHVTMFAWLAGLAIAALWRRSATAMLWLPAPQAARWGGLLAAAAYALFSGWGVPSQRTVWMLAAVTVLQALGLRWPWPLVLLAAAVVVTVFDPWALLQAGFWLSFVAVGLLMASEPVRRGSLDDVARDGPGAGPASPAGAVLRLWHAARGGALTQWRVTLGLTPLSLVFFQQVSLVGFAANLVAIPLVTLVITPLALLGAVAAPLWTVGAWAVQRLADLLAWLAALPGAVWVVPVAPLWAQWAGLLAAVVLVLPLPWRTRVLALPLLLPLLWPVRSLPAAGEFELLAVDVGQGTAVLVRTREHLLVYDAGPQYSRDSDAGQRVLLPLLRALGERRIDRLVLSHRDLDHVGGAAALLKGLPVGEVMSSLEPAHPLLALATRPSRCEAGQSWAWDGVTFDVLHPPPADYARSLKPNAMSCVLRVSAPGGSALLTGDIERDQEAALLAVHGAMLRSSVLVVPHHGSKTSSTDAFLAAVQPQAAVIQAGYRNRFGHPAPEVSARLQERGIRTLASAGCGAWRWRSSEGVDGTCERQATCRYWRHDAAR
jgi:competence protein ComEC